MVVLACSPARTVSDSEKYYPREQCARRQLRALVNRAFEARLVAPSPWLDPSAIVAGRS